jgi:hypothetical protein
MLRRSFDIGQEQSTDQNRLALVSRLCRTAAITFMHQNKDSMRFLYRPTARTPLLCRDRGNVPQWRHCRSAAESFCERHPLRFQRIGLSQEVVIGVHSVSSSKIIAECAQSLPAVICPADMAGRRSITQVAA